MTLPFNTRQEILSYPENKYEDSVKLLHKITMLGYTFVQIESYIKLHPEDMEYKKNCLVTLNNIQRELSNIRVSISISTRNIYSEPSVYLKIYAMYAQILQMNANDLEFELSTDLHRNSTG